MKKDEDNIVYNNFEIVPNSNQKEKEELFKTLYSLYDYVNWIDLNTKKIKRIYTGNGGYIGTDTRFEEYIKSFSQKYVHPDDIENYLEFSSIDRIRSRIESVDRNFIMSYFRTLKRDGTYGWKAFIILKPPMAEEGVYLSCIRDVDSETEHILIKNDYVRLFNDLPLAYAVFQLEGNSVEDLKAITIIYASNRLAKLVGVDFDSILGMNFLSFLSEGEKPAVKLLYDAAFKGIRGRKNFYIRYFDRWFCLIADQAATSGKCAVIFEDITKEHMANERLDREWRTDDVIINCTKLLHSGVPHDVAINEIIKIVGEAIEADRIYIIERVSEKQFSETYEWSNVGIESAKDRFQGMVRNQMFNWEDEYPGAFCFVIDNVETIESAHPRLYAMCKEFGIESIIELPITEDDRLMGYFGAYNFNKEKNLDCKELMETISYFLSSEFGRRRLIDELEKKSIYDSLCDVRNRAAMEMTAKKLKKRNYSVGVMYADANGLKVINDTQGHEAGDELLKRICAIMRKHFNRDCIYRAGGDEFVVIVSKVTKEAFIESCEELKKDFNDAENLSVAVGWDWGVVSSALDTIMKSADTLMYQDKADYYRKNNRRRSSDR